MSNLLNETFQKHLKLLNQKLNLKEVTDQEVIEKARDQKDKFKSHLGAGKFGLNLIRNDIIDLIENPNSEFKKYYPDWTHENFLLYYKELFGKEYSAEVNEKINETFQKHLGLLRNRLNELEEPSPLAPVVGRKKTWDDNREYLLNSMKTTLDKLKQHNTDEVEEKHFNDLIKQFVTFCVIHGENPNPSLQAGYYLVIDDIVKDIDKITGDKKITSPPQKEQLQDVINKILEKYKYLDVKNPDVLKDIDIKDDGRGGILSANYRNQRELSNYEIDKLPEDDEEISYGQGPAHFNRDPDAGY